MIGGGPKERRSGSGRRRANVSRPAVGLLLILLPACAADPASRPENDRREENKRLVRRYLEEVVNTGDVSRLPEFVSPEYSEVYENEVHPLGLEGARQHVLGVRRAFPDLLVTVEQQIAEGEWVASRVTARGTHLGEFLGTAPTGRSLEMTGVNFDRVVGGRIVQHAGAANLLGPLLAAGAVEIVPPEAR